MSDTKLTELSSVVLKSEESCVSFSKVMGFSVMKMSSFEGVNKRAAAH